MALLKIGKLPPAILESKILSRHGARRNEVLVRPRIGEDCSVVDLGGGLCVLSTDPITGATRDLGRLAVHVSCNDVAANGAEPVGILLTILAPPGTPEEEIAEVMRQVDEIARTLNIEVLGGHTEVTDAVNRMVVSSTVIGKAVMGRVVTSSGARPGDEVVLTKTAGVEGTAILAVELKEFLTSRLGEATVQQVRRFSEQISVVPEGMIAAGHNATAMHDVTEGGLLGALYEMATASGTGVEVDLPRVPVAEETRQITTILGIDPLRLIGSGSMLIATPEGDQLISALREAGVPAARIGRIVERGFYLMDGETRHKFGPPESDELYKALSRAKEGRV
ncbi:MAG: AIR synthase family protein [Syntrophothermus sp.]